MLGGVDDDAVDEEPHDLLALFDGQPLVEACANLGQQIGVQGRFGIGFGGGFEVGQAALDLGGLGRDAIEFAI